MLKRVDIENRELNTLDERAMKAVNTKGRALPEEKCEYRTEFVRDRDRIIHSKALRRLKHKTQVFLSPEGDHYRTRLTHTLEVSQVARTIARILNYNEDLTEAIALGHDLGHTPFGHNGEMVLNSIHPGGFKHNVQSLRVVELLETGQDRNGMNLTYEVKDGILNHTGDIDPITLEGQIVKISDRIAYVNHDMDDAIRSGVITMPDFPKWPIKILGETHSKRINNLIESLVISSERKDRITLDDEHGVALDEMRSFMFENVYNSENVKKAEDLNKVEVVITSLYNYYVEHPDKMPKIYHEIVKNEGTNVAVKDYIAGMTDRYALSAYSELFVPKAWK
ncbi:MAG: deoxyguanosinetriphosphate triphosphohydrolase [Peptostreptococcaceae bacterium]|nr:deoxyguanosinetriphosphate triphosphohydrolase [Peptostreptococcaceae bacterium]